MPISDYDHLREIPKDDPDYDKLWLEYFNERSRDMFDEDWQDLPDYHKSHPELSEEQNYKKTGKPFLQKDATQRRIEKMLQKANLNTRLLQALMEKVYRKRHRVGTVMNLVQDIINMLEAEKIMADFDRVISSPLSNYHQVVELMADDMLKTVQLYAASNFGRYEGLEGGHLPDSIIKIPAQGVWDDFSFTITSEYRGYHAIADGRFVAYGRILHIPSYRAYTLKEGEEDQEFVIRRGRGTWFREPDPFIQRECSLIRAKYANALRNAVARDKRKFFGDMQKRLYSSISMLVNQLEMSL